MTRLFSLLALAGLLMATGCGTNASTLQNTAVGTNAAMNGLDDDDKVADYYNKMSIALGQTFGHGNVSRETVLNYVNSGSINRMSDGQNKRFIYELHDVANNPAKWNKMDANKDGLLNAREVSYYGSVPHIGGW